MDRISKHISYNEGVVSNTAKREGIDNTPNKTVLKRMALVAEKCFEPIREKHGRPLRINSFYRSPELNKAVGGSKTSQHMSGEAIDFTSGSKRENKILYNWMRDNLEVDQLIWEYGGKWIHVSYKKKGNRNMSFNIGK